MSFTLTPPILIEPSDTSQNLATSDARVVLPPPDGPTKAMCWPGLISRVTRSKAFLSEPSYENDTLSKEILLSFGVAGSAASGSGSTSRSVYILIKASFTII